MRRWGDVNELACRRGKNWRGRDHGSIIVCPGHKLRDSLAPYATAQRPRSVAEWEDRCVTEGYSTYSPFAAHSRKHRRCPSLAEGLRVALPSDRRGSDRGEMRPQVSNLSDLRSCFGFCYPLINKVLQCGQVYREFSE
jgi:hypothetical protein